MTKTQATDKTQADKFADLARELECDESEEAFEETVRKVAGKNTAPEATKPEETS